MEKKTDRRVLKTKAAIKEAFFTLLEEIPLEKLTVKELCDAADINRSSFYDHYLDYPDFLDKLAIETANMMLAQFDELFVRDDYAVVTMKKYLHLLKNSRETKLIFSKSCGDTAIHFFETALKERTFADWLRYGEITESQAEYLFRYIVRGGFAVMQLWYEGGFVESEEEIQALLTKVITSGLYAFIHTKR